MQARKVKTAKVQRRTVAKKRQRGRIPHAAERTISGNNEELLLKRATEAGHTVPLRGLQIQDIFYSSAPELRVLAFKSGFNLGAEAYRKSGGSMGPLQRLLENAGLGKIVYYPFESRSTFTSRALKHWDKSLGVNLHVFESGIISGYLSAHAGRSVIAEETACVFNGSNHCMFLAKPGSLHADLHHSLEFADILRALRYAVEHAETQRGWHGYYVLETIPLFSEPVFSESLKFLYLLGKMTAEGHLPRPEREVALAALFVGLDGAKVTSAKKHGVSITLSYRSETSLGRFVDITSAFMSGIVKGAYGRNVKVSRTLSGRGVYNVKMEVLEGFNNKVA